MAMFSNYSKNKETLVVSGLCPCWLLAGACGPWARKWTPHTANVVVIQLSNLIKNIFICVPKTNEGLTGLVQHGGE